MPNKFEQYRSLLKNYEFHPYICIRPLWYHQSPIERLRRVVDRISQTKILRYKDIEKFSNKYNPATFRAIRDDMFNGIYFRGYKRPHGWLSNSRGRPLIEIKEACHDGLCKWCGTPLYKKKTKGFRYFDNVCKDRFCREVEAVLIGKHKEIKQIRNVEFGENFINSFMAAFFVRKVKSLQKKQRKLKSIERN